MLESLVFAGPKVGMPVVYGSGVCPWASGASLSSMLLPRGGMSVGVVASTGKVGKTQFTPVLLIYWFSFTSLERAVLKPMKFDYVYLIYQ